MKKYQIMKNGTIFDTEKNLFIPPVIGNRFYDMYIEWTSIGNNPEPFPAEDPWTEIRRYRDCLLTKSDWTQISDAPISAELKESYRIYRQTLRDIPQTYTNIKDIVWPVEPNF